MPNDKKLSEFPSLPFGAQLLSNEKIASEVKRISPSAIVTLFEIDAENILIDKNLKYDFVNRRDAVFRFHNNLKLINQNIYWKGQEYKALPIKVTGFETNTRGALPTPRMSIFFDDKNLDSLSYFRFQLRMVDDLIGAKVTRVRTFAKYLDEKNFFLRIGGKKTAKGNVDLILPQDFEPDPNAEFPREIFYIERKTSESPLGIEFDLSSAIDFENIKLPRRLILAKTCNFTYRGEGCLYESYKQHYYKRSGEDVFRVDKDKLTEALNSDNIKLLNLPTQAFPVATENDEIIAKLVGSSYEMSAGAGQVKWDPAKKYKKGNIVYTERASIKSYYVAKQTVPVGKALESEDYWIADRCSKTIKGCKLRWSDREREANNVYGTGDGSYGGDASVSGASRGSNLANTVGDGKTHDGGLPFGGFPGTEDRR